MVKVYTDDVLEFEGTVRESAEFINLSYMTLRRLIKLELQYLPAKAKCDYIVFEDDKIVKKVKVKRKDIYVGMTISVDGILYELTNIQGQHYTFKSELNEYTFKFENPAKKNTIYNRIKRQRI